MERRVEKCLEIDFESPDEAANNQPGCSHQDPATTSDITVEHPLPPVATAMLSEFTLKKIDKVCESWRKRKFQCHVAIANAEGDTLCTDILEDQLREPMARCSTLCHRFEEIKFIAAVKGRDHHSRSVWQRCYSDMNEVFELMKGMDRAVKAAQDMMKRSS